MPKKMNIIPSIFKNKQAKHPWQWPSCKHPETLSFREHGFRCDDVYPTPIKKGAHEPSTSSNSEEAPPSLEVVMSGVRRSERLFFEPEETSSMVRGSSECRRRAFKDSVAMVMESEDPYRDFKRSMEEMVESEGLLKDWDCLEELLLWYLRMNGKVNHGFIVGAFVDLLVGFAAAESKKKKKKKMVSDSMSTTTYYSSASSSFSSPSSPLSPHLQL